MTVGKGCQMGNEMFLCHPVLCPVVICREFEAVGSCGSEITLSCLLSGISHETENFCSGCFISPSAHPLPYLMRLMSCHPICHPNTKFQKTARESLWCKCNLLMCFFHFTLTFETVDFSSRLCVHSPTEMHFSLEGEEVERFTTAWEVSIHLNRYQGKVCVRKRFWGFGWCVF